MTISYNIHFDTGAPLAGTGSQIVSNLSIDGAAAIKWTDPITGAIRLVDYIEFTYNDTYTNDILLELSCSPTACLGPLAYTNLGASPPAKQGGLRWTNSGSKLSVTITPPEPPPPPLTTDCTTYPKVQWANTGTSPPTKLHVKIKRQKDSANPC